MCVSGRKTFNWRIFTDLVQLPCDGGSSFANAPSIPAIMFTKVRGVSEAVSVVSEVVPILWSTRKCE